MKPEVDLKAAIYLAAAFEYVCADLLQVRYLVPGVGDPFPF